MVKHDECKNCIHFRVCSKISNYQEYCKKINDLCITPSENTVLYAKDCEYITLTMQCKHFRQEKYNAINEFGVRA